MVKDKRTDMDRRSVIKKTAAASLSVAAVVTGTAQGMPASKPIGRRSLIQRENELRGTRDWQLTRVWPNRNKFRTSLIEGYCSHQSIAAGESLDIFVSCDPQSEYTIDIYRLGYYGGTGACHKKTIGPLTGKTQAVPAMTADPARLRECHWDLSVSLEIPDNWVSGVYIGKLTTVAKSSADPYWQSYVIFIVKDDRSADVLFQCSDNTWQAYNRWPENESLYTHPAGAHAPGVAVSFNRPYGMYTQIFEPALSIGSGEFLLWEYPLCYWLEQQGYDVTYGSNADGIGVDFITRCKTFLSVGHDEYWDIRQYHAAELAIERGVNYLWLSGNSVFIVSPFSDSATGTPKRTITREGCYGVLRSDEIESYEAMFAGLRDTGLDERRIIGARSVVPFNGGGDWTCNKPKHWLFQGTGMKRGESIPGLVGWEHHGEPDVERHGLEILAEGSVWSGGTREGKYASTIFPGGNGNFVFNAATIFWSQGLSTPPGHVLPWSHWSRPHGPDTRVQQMTTNLLDQAIGSR